MTRTDLDTVYIGDKPVMQYVLASMSALNNYNRVDIKARGRNITKAVDVFEILRHKFARDAKGTLVSDTEEVEVEERICETKDGIQTLKKTGNTRKVMMSSLLITVSNPEDKDDGKGKETA